MFNTKNSNTMENQTFQLGQTVKITKGEHKGLKAVIFSLEAFDNGIKLKIDGQQIYNGPFSSFPKEWVESAEVTEGLKDRTPKFKECQKVIHIQGKDKTETVRINKIEFIQDAFVYYLEKEHGGERIKKPVNEKFICGILDKPTKEQRAIYYGTEQSEAPVEPAEAVKPKFELGQKVEILVPSQKGKTGVIVRVKENYQGVYFLDVMINSKKGNAVCFFCAEDVKVVEEPLSVDRIDIDEADKLKFEPTTTPEGLDAYELDTIKTLIRLKLEAAKEASERVEDRLNDKELTSRDFWQMAYKNRLDIQSTIQEIFDLFELGKESKKETSCLKDN